MKSFNFVIEDRFFKEINSVSIRKKADVVHVLLRSIEYILTLGRESGSKKVDDANTISIYVDKMSRLFVSRKDGYKYSVNFPFILEKIGDEYHFYLQNYNYEITLQMANYLKVAFAKFSDKDTYNELISFEEDEDRDLNESELLAVFKELLEFEPGYIRYECDEDNEDGNNHPLHHYDINFSNSVTFKVGLTDEIDINGFNDFLNVRTECLYLKPQEKLLTEKRKSMKKKSRTKS